jgi:exodeoxyribonuclease VII small subunit
MTNNTDIPSSFDFAATLKELEEITAWFETETVDLEQALVKFERGMTLASQLRQYLQQTQNRVEQIKQKFDTPDESAAGDSAADPGPAAESDDTPDLFS